MRGNFTRINFQLNLMNKAAFYIIFLLLALAGFAPAGSMQLHAQPSCEISIDKPLPVCPNSNFELSVPEGEGYKYLWTTLDGTVLDTTSSFLLKLTETTEIIVRVTDTVNFEECESDPFEITVHTPIEIEFVQQQLTCTNGDNDNGNTAQVRAIAGGEFQPDEYHYFWEVKPIQIAPGDSSLAIGLKAHLIYNIIIKDNYGCELDTGFRTEAYDNPEVEIYADPDTAYIQNPHITFSFVNLSSDSIDIINHFWEFYIGDPAYQDSIVESDLDEPVITFPTIGTWPAFLTVYNTQGCDTLYSHIIEVKPVKLFIPNVFTPKPASPGTNDFFEIVLDEANKNPEIPLNRYYQSSKLVVFNRWGKKVYQSDDYQNDWDGGGLPDGVYYYVLKCEGYKSNDVFKGAVTIIGTGKTQ